jgi:phosphoribosylformylglycinamidine synthase
MTTVDVRVSLKRGVTDPEGDSVKKALNLLGFSDVTTVRSAKIYTITMIETDKEKARKRVKEMCARLLANPVINDYRIDVYD